MKKKSHPRILKVIAANVIVLLIIVISTLFFLEQYTERIARSVLNTEFSKLELSRVYHVDFDKVSLQILSGNIRIKNLQINPKESFYTEPDSLKAHYPLLVDIVIPKLTIKGLNKNFILQFEILNIPFISAIRPEIRLIDHLTDAEKARSHKIRQEKVTLVETSKWRSINVGQFVIDDGMFEWHDLTKNRSLFQTGSINYSGTQLEFLSENIFGSLVKMLMERSDFETGPVQYFTKNGFYEVAAGSLSKRIGVNKLQADHIKLIPQYDKMEFGRRFGRQTDWIDLEVKSIEIDEPDIFKWLEDRTISVHEIRIEYPILHIFRDKNIARDMSIFPDLPHQLLSSIKSAVDIRKIQVRNASLVYEELEPGANDPGQVPAKNIYATLYNVTNIPSSISAHGAMTWDIRADFFDQAKLEVSFNFPENLAEHRFAFAGKMDSMDMNAFNVILTPHAGIRIDQGYLRSIDFDVIAYEHFSEGEVTMYYEDLKLTVLRKSNPEGQRIFGLVTFLANAAIKGNNPEKESHMTAEPSPVFFERDKNKSIFNYMARSMISGIQNTIVPGTGMTREKYEKQQNMKDIQPKNRTLQGRKARS
ncbi:MAG: hypothetical protein ACNA7V_03330 [Bacteroidales bacterium]